VVAEAQDSDGTTAFPPWLRAAVPGASSAFPQAQIAEGLTVTGDQELLRRALDNPLMNVLVHTPAAPGLAASAS
jgi:hypothetical protein